MTGSAAAGRPARTVLSAQQLTDEQLREVLRLAETAAAQDRVAPLSEQVLLDARSESTTGSGSTGPSHFLAYAGTHLSGYAHLEAEAGDEAATGEVVVDPAYRHQGIGTALVQALDDVLAQVGSTARTLQVWAHGDLEGARALAGAGGFSTVRELWQMRRSLVPDSGLLPATSLPEGFVARHFVVDQDEEAWLQVNARAFVNHPEQGRMTRSDLDQRISEPWFDAGGFLLIDDLRGLAPVLAASHWTKVVPGTSGKDPTAQPEEGEVYVVGVDPAYQGLGLGRTVTILGLAHLRDSGLTQAALYVDADNEAAVATYLGLDFVRFAVDTMYSRAVHPSV